MELREWALAGVLFDPFVLYLLAALPLTGLLRWLIRRTPLAPWIWHEALFDSALLVCVLAGLTAASAALT